MLTRVLRGSFRHRWFAWSFSPLRHYDIRDAPDELAAARPVTEDEAETDAAAV